MRSPQGLYLQNKPQSKRAVQVPTNNSSKNKILQNLLHWRLQMQREVLKKQGNFDSFIESKVCHQL